MSQSSRAVWTAIPLLLIFYVARLSAIDIVPPFIDEAFLIETAERIYETSPLFRSGEGRLFASWYMALAGAPYGASFFVARAVTTLLVVLGAGAAASIAYRLGGLPGMVAVFVLLGASPYLIFFDAFANIEPMLTAFVLLAVALTLRLRDRANLWDAVLVGVALFVALGTKLNALPHIVIPAVGVITLRPTGRELSANIRWGAFALGTFALLYGTLTAVQYWRGYDPFFLLLTSSSGGGFLERILPRTTEIAGALWTYSNLLWLGIVALGVILLAVRRQFFLLLAVGVAFATVWLTGKYFTRYLYPHVAGLLIIGAVGLGLVLRGRPRIATALLGLLAAAGVFQHAAFVRALRTEPVAVLTTRDYAEHYQGDASGAGLDEMLGYLEAAGAERVIGMMSNCKALAYQAVPPVIVECPRASSSGEDREPLAQMAEALAGERVWIVLENTPYVPAVVPGDVIAEVTRPGNISRLQLIDLSAASP